jgi:hypothetical protein
MLLLTSPFPELVARGKIDRNPKQIAKSTVSCKASKTNPMLVGQCFVDH